MKKLLIASMVLALVSCGGATDGDADTDTTTLPVDTSTTNINTNAGSYTTDTLNAPDSVSGTSPESRRTTPNNVDTSGR